MRIAPLADVKARLSAYLDDCAVDGPLVITRNGKAVAVLLVPYDDEDLERLLLGRSPRFQALLDAAGKRDSTAADRMRELGRAVMRLDAGDGGITIGLSGTWAPN